MKKYSITYAIREMQKKTKTKKTMNRYYYPPTPWPKSGTLPVSIVDKPMKQQMHLFIPSGSEK
jgi:hypothetical protein